MVAELSVELDIEGEAGVYEVFSSGVGGKIIVINCYSKRPDRFEII